MTEGLDMLSKSTPPRHAARGWPWWPIPVAILGLIAVVAGVVFLPRMWIERLSQADGGAASSGGSDLVTCAKAGEAKASIAVANDYAAALQSVVTAFNDSAGSCAIEATSYTDPAHIAELKAGDSPPSAVLGSDSATSLTEAFGTQLSDQGTVAQTQGVIAVPESLVGPLGWTGSPLWSEVARTLPNAERWSASASADLGNFNVALVEMESSAVTRGFGLGMVAATLGKAPQDVTAVDLSSSQAQSVLLGLVRQATVRASGQAELVERLQIADDGGNLASVVSAAVMDEQSVIAYNSSNPKVKLTAFYPSEPSVTVAINYRITPDAPDEVKQFGTFLASEDGQKAIKNVGLRGSDGSTGDGFTDSLNAVGQPAVAPMSMSDAISDALSQGWQRMTHPGRFLVLMDVSGSMASTVPGTGRTRLQFAQEAAITGIRMVPPGASIGLWEFSTNLDGSKDHRELVSVGPLQDSIGGQSRLDSLVSAVNALSPRSDTGMYDSALEAFRTMKASYTPGEPNVVVLITDGRNDDVHTIDLKTLLATLKAEQDPERPVRFLTLAYGEKADEDALAQIAEVTGGSAYVAPNPTDIGSVFFQALMNG